MNSKKDNKKAKNIIIFLVIVGVVIIFGGYLFSTVFSPIKKQLELGQKYLYEEDWEQALVAFDEAIRIDPKNEKAYIGKAEVYIGKEDAKQAIEVLMEGYYATSSVTIKEKIKEIADDNGIDVIIPELGGEKISDMAAIIDDASNPEGEENNSDANVEVSTDDASINENNANKTVDLTDSELAAICDNLSRARGNYLYGHISIDSVDALCTYWIPVFEEMKKNDSAVVDYCNQALEYLYYMAQDWNACLAIRTEVYNPYGYSEPFEVTHENADGTVTLNEFGIGIHDFHSYSQDGSWQYDQETTHIYGEDGRIHSRNSHNVYEGGGTMDTEWQFEYDSQGLLIKEEYNTLMVQPGVDSSTNHCITSYTYSGNTITENIYSEHTDWRGVNVYEETFTYTMDEYGKTYSDY